jgi:hypothetical protein
MSSNRRFSWPLALVLAVAILVGGGLWVFERISSWPSRTWVALTDQSAAQARRVRDTFVDLFQVQPRITVHDRVIYQEAKQALELAVVSRETEVSRQSTHTWIGSTKVVRIRATCRVKAGFELGERLAVDVRGTEVIVRVSHASILSVEPTEIIVEELRNGLWNKIQPQDVTGELKALLDLARRKEATLPQEAEQTFSKLLGDNLSGLNVRLEFETPRPASP